MNIFSILDAIKKGQESFDSYVKAKEITDIYFYGEDLRSYGDIYHCFPSLKGIQFSGFKVKFDSESLSYLDVTDTYWLNCEVEFQDLDNEDSYCFERLTFDNCSGVVFSCRLRSSVVDVGFVDCNIFRSDFIFKGRRTGDLRFKGCNFASCGRVELSADMIGRELSLHDTNINCLKFILPSFDPRFAASIVIEATAISSAVKIPSYNSINDGSMTIVCFDSKFYEGIFVDSIKAGDSLILRGNYFASSVIIRNSSFDNGKFEISENVHRSQHLSIKGCRFTDLEHFHLGGYFSDGVSVNVGADSIEANFMTIGYVNGNNCYFNISFQNLTIKEMVRVVNLDIRRSSFHLIGGSISAKSMECTETILSRSSLAIRSEMQIDTVHFRSGRLDDCSSIDLELSRCTGSIFMQEINFNEKSSLRLTESEVDGKTYFDFGKDLTELSEFSLESSKFNNVVKLPQGVYGCVPNLLHCDFKIVPSISEVAIDYPKNKQKLRFFQEPDYVKALHLKDLAIEKNDYRKTLDFHAMELSLSPKRKLGIALPFYKIFSDFGRSIGRPFSALLGLIGMMAMVYSSFIKKSLAVYEYIEVLLFSFQVSIGVGVVQKTALSSFMTKYGLDDSSMMLSAMLLQGLLSFLFLFLIGLALRNRFKIS